MHIDFIPMSKEAEIVIPMPKPAKLYIPDWYKNVKNEKGEFDSEGQFLGNGIKRCMPFLDSFTTGYIQESWTDIYIKNTGENSVNYSFPMGPSILHHRNNESFVLPDIYYKIEFVWKIHWIPKMPKGWSVILTHPHNRLDLPFRSLTGVIDSDEFHHLSDPDGGNYPFHINKGFEGIIPAGTPMYQIIPFKREHWTSSLKEYDEYLALKKRSMYKKYVYDGYKRMFWQKKTYE